MKNEWPKAQRLILESMQTRYPADVVRTLDAASDKDVAAYLSRLPPTQAARLFERLRPDLATASLQHLDDAIVSPLLAVCDPGLAAARLAPLDVAFRERMLALLPAAVAGEIATLVAYPFNSAGSLMDPRITTFRPDTRVRDVTARLHAIRQKKITHLLIVNDDGELAGMVPIQEVILAEPKQQLGELVQPSTPSVLALAPREEVVETLAKTPVTTLPVVDINGRLLGVIRHTALVQAVQEEALASVQTMVGVSRDERALSSPWFAVRKRLPWLNINLLTAFLAAAVVGMFEKTIAQVTALAVLLPVVAGQSGNTGAQALAVTMRGLALREIRIRQWPRMIWKEAAAGFINGTAVAIVTAVGVLIWSRSLVLGFVIGTAMVMSMAIAGVAGAMVPILLTAIGQDPAQSSSIILTTVTDVMGFLSFLGLATLFVGLL